MSKPKRLGSPLSLSEAALDALAAVTLEHVIDVVLWHREVNKGKKGATLLDAVQDVTNRPNKQPPTE